MLVIEIGVHWTEYGGEGVPERLGHALDVRVNGAIDQEGGGGGLGIIVVFDEAPKTTRIVGEVGFCLFTHFQSSGVLIGAYFGLNSVNQGPVRGVKVGGGGVSEEESSVPHEF
jgi:hypothetical protein